MMSIEEFATEYAQDKYLPVQTSQAVKAGANYVLEEINNKVNRSFLEDFEGMEEHDREIAQGAIAMVNIWIQQLKGE